MVERVRRGYEKARATECSDDGRTGKGVDYSIVYGFGWGQRVETAGRDSGGRKVGHGGLPG